MCTKHLCVLIHIRINGDVGTIKHVQALTIPRQCYFCGSSFLLVFRVCLCYSRLSVPCSIVIRTDLLAFLYVMFSYFVVSFQYGVPCQVLNLIVSIADICLLLYFKQGNVKQGI